MRFSWEVLNVTNTSRFDASVISSLGELIDEVTTFGVYSHQLV